MAEKRQGRGRLSILDTLPEAAQPDLHWLKDELRANKRPQVELLDLFNARLAVLGIEPISVGSFSRYSMRKAISFRELDATMRMSRELADMLGTDSSDQLTITLSNMLQVAGVKLVEAEGANLAAKDIMELAKAVQAVVSAQKQSADYRRTLERENAQKVEEAQKDVAAIGKQHGVSDEAMKKITQRLAGIA